MVVAEIGDHCNLAFVVAEAAPENAASCHFQNSSLNCRIPEEHLRAPRACIVAGDNQFAGEINAVGCGLPYSQALLSKDVADHADSGSLAVSACDSNQWNPPIPFREEMGDDPVGNRSAFSFRRV